MQINWTEQNSRTGPGLAAPTLSLTHTHTHTDTHARQLIHKHEIEMLLSTDPAPTKLKLTPLLNDMHAMLEAIYSTWATSGRNNLILVPYWLRF